MYPFNMNMFGGKDEDEEDLTVDSSKEDLWEEITDLRERLKQEESARQDAERRYDGILAGATFAGKPILVLKGIVSYEDLRAIAEQWQKLAPRGAVFAIPPDVQVQELSDEDLAQMGLTRVSNGPITERDLYESMLRGK